MKSEILSDICGVCPEMYIGIANILDFPDGPDKCLNRYNGIKIDCNNKYKKMRFKLIIQ